MTKMQTGIMRGGKTIIDIVQIYTEKSIRLELCLL